MTDTEAWKAMEDGKKIRRPSWREGYYMTIENGIEMTYDEKGTHIATGFRSFTGEPVIDWEVV